LKIVVGLGNPGDRYRHTRHNLGFLAVEEFCRRRHFRWRAHECGSITAGGRVGTEAVLVAKPETYMNLSGEAVSCLLKRSAAAPSDLLVVCDDIAIDLGSIRVRPSGRDGGHRGLRSIIEALQTEDFGRVRIGIRTSAAEPGDLADHVLAPFATEEWAVASEQISRAAQCVQVVLEQGVRVAMNRFNRRQPRDPGHPAAS